MHISFSDKYETSLPSEGHLESALEDLREKSDMDIAEYKAMIDVVYRDKVCTSFLGTN